MQAIDRVLAILEAVTEETDGATASHVSASTDLSLSTTTRLLHQLAERNVLVRTDGDRRYVLGPRLFGLVRRGSAHIDISTLARPILHRLRDVTAETASIHVRRGDSRICVAAVTSVHPIARRVSVGTAMPLHRNATGEVLLAGADPEERSRYIADLRLPPHEEKMLQRRLERIAHDGWALVVDDWVPGVTGISAAVTDGDLTVAAISVSGPAARFTAETATSHLPTLLASAAELAQWGVSSVA